jgi:hypothetical protein
MGLGPRGWHPGLFNRRPFRALESGFLWIDSVAWEHSVALRGRPTAIGLRFAGSGLSRRVKGLLPAVKGFLRCATRQ